MFKLFRRGTRVSDEELKEIYERASVQHKELINQIKGYVGYYKLKTRKLSDFRFREESFKKLSEIINRFQKIHSEFIQQQILTTWSLSEDIRKILNMIKKHVKEPDYKFSTFFEKEKIEIDLNEIYMCEYTVYTKINDLLIQVLKLQDNLDEGDIEDLLPTLIKIHDTAKKILEELKKRNELISSIEVF